MERLNIQVNLPLPPSKNRRLGFRVRPIFLQNGKLIKKKWQVIPYSTKETREYEEIVSAMLHQWKGKIKKDDTVILQCWWRVRRQNQDVINFHDELADAIAQALGIDDRNFLIRDMEKRYDLINAGVRVKIKTE